MRHLRTANMNIQFTLSIFSLCHLKQQAFLSLRHNKPSKTLTPVPVRGRSSYRYRRRLITRAIICAIER